MILIFVILLGIALLLYFFNFKVIHYSNLMLVSGAVKGGKSLFSLYIAERKWRSLHFSWFLRTKILPYCLPFSKNKRKQLKEIEEPLFYTNIHVAFKHVMLDTDYLLRKKRFNYKSVIFIDEASLTADSQNFKDMFTNDNLLLFNKLIGHETHGGYLFYNTQSVQDLHYSIKRCITKYYWIDRCIKWIPFIVVFKMKEMVYSEDGSMVNVNGLQEHKDEEDCMRTLIISKRYFKHYDRYAFSILTDNLKDKHPRIVVNKVGDYLKCDEIVSFKDWELVKDKSNYTSDGKLRKERIKHD